MLKPYIRAFHFALIVQGMCCFAAAAVADAGDDYRDLTAKGVFVSECQFPARLKAMLIHPVNSDHFYVVLRNGKNVNDISSVKLEADGNLVIDTNGGIGKQLGINQVFHVLIESSFRYVSANAFLSYMQRPAARSCPMKYPFSP